MSIENDSTKPAFIESSIRIEPVDLRLFSAFKVWEEFKSSHGLDLSSIRNLNTDQIANTANELADSVYNTIGAGTESGTSKVSKKKLDQLVAKVSKEGNTTIFVRHAEQSPPEWVFSIPRQDIRKIRMMQNPFNNEDLITNKAVAEAFSTGMVVLYMKAITGKNVRLFSSENMRALEIAKVISKMVDGTTYTTDEGLTCITYKDETDEPSVTLEQLLADLPSGFMPWNPELVDKWCKSTKSGKKPSQAIVNSVRSLYQEGLNQNGNDLIIALTHSQQLGEVQKASGRLHDPGERFPELSILIPSDEDLFILRGGIFKEKGNKENPNKKKDVRKILERIGAGYEWYKIRRDEYGTDEKIPFLVSPEPLVLTKAEAQEIQEIGDAVTTYISAVEDLYRTDEDVKKLLDTSKPEELKNSRETRYLFVRPDLIVCDDGFSICEIETSPFGLALAELLNEAYIEASFSTMVPDSTLKDYLFANTPQEGTIVYGSNTAQYSGQLEFLAEKIMSDETRHWSAQHIDTAITRDHSHLYRGFYSYEPFDDLFMHNLVMTRMVDGDISSIYPSLTPHIEEKAVLALIWDKRWESYFKNRLGQSTFDHLRRVIPPTWIVGQEDNFAPGLPDGVQSTIDLANISKSKRNYVLKKSGFGHGSSWAEGVNFLQEKSASKAKELLKIAAADSSSLYIVQEFRKGKEISMAYDDRATHKLKEMKARVRITPYFSMQALTRGQLIAIKATGCENTNYIHASTGSINTAVSVE